MAGSGTPPATGPRTCAHHATCGSSSVCSPLQGGSARAASRARPDRDRLGSRRRRRRSGCCRRCAGNPAHHEYFRPPAASWTYHGSRRSSLNAAGSRASPRPGVGAGSCFPSAGVHRGVSRRADRGAAPGTRSSTIGRASLKNAPRARRPPGARSPRRSPGPVRTGKRLSGVELDLHATGGDLGGVRVAIGAVQDVVDVLPVLVRHLPDEVGVGEQVPSHAVGGALVPEVPRSSDSLRVDSSPHSSPPIRPLPSGTASSQVAMGAERERFSSGPGRRAGPDCGAPVASSMSTGHKARTSRTSRRIARRPPFPHTGAGGASRAAARARWRL